MEIVAILTIVANAIINVVRIIMDYRKSRTDVWETALKITTSDQYNCSADEFARNYELLKAFKDEGCSLCGEASIRDMFRKKHPQTTESEIPPKESLK